MPSEENRPSKYLLHNLSILRDGSLPPTIRLMEESKMDQFEPIACASRSLQEHKKCYKVIEFEGL